MSGSQCNVGWWILVTVPYKKTDVEPCYTKQIYVDVKLFRLNIGAFAELVKRLSSRVQISVVPCSYGFFYGRATFQFKHYLFFNLKYLASTQTFVAVLGLTLLFWTLGVSLPCNIMFCIPCVVSHCIIEVLQQQKTVLVKNKNLIKAELTNSSISKTEVDLHNKTYWNY